jgi:hypothetical protein
MEDEALLTPPFTPGMAYASSMASDVDAILNGSSGPDPTQHGLTSEDERARCNMPQARGRVGLACRGNVTDSCKQ